MSSDGLMIVQLAAVALLASVLLVVWGDLGAYAFVKRMNGGVKFILGLLAMAGMIAVMVAPKYVLGPTERRDSIDRPEAKGPAIDFDWPLLSLADGKEVNLSSFKGKVLFVNLWATWCKPCVNEMPSIESLYQKFAGRDDVAFLLVSLDDSPAEPRAFAAKTGMKAPIYFARGRPPRGFQSQGIPLTVIVRKDGTQGLRQEGSWEWNGSAGIINDLAKAPSADQQAAKESKQ